MLLGLVAVTGCVADGAPDDTIELANAGVAPSRSIWVDDTVRVGFELSERIGGGSDIHSFGKVGAVAVDAEGRFAVYDLMDCSISLIEPVRTSFLRIGRCGDGPDEFRMVANMSFSGDELLAATGSSLILQRFDRLGHEVGRIRLFERGIEDASGILEVHDSLLLVAQTVFAPETDSIRGALLLAISPTTGAVRGRALRVPPMSASNTDAASDFVSVCLGAMNDQKVVVVGHMWALQTTVLDATNLMTLRNDVTSTPWAGGVRPAVPGRPVPLLRPRFRANAVQCLELGTVTWARKTDWERFPPENVGAMMEIRDWAGGILYRGGNPPQVPPGARPVAAWRNKIVFASNEEIPELIVIDVVPISR